MLLVEMEKSYKIPLPFLCHSLRHQHPEEQVDYAMADNIEQTKQRQQERDLTSSPETSSPSVSRSNAWW